MIRAGRRAQTPLLVSSAIAVLCGLATVLVPTAPDKIRMIMATASACAITGGFTLTCFLRSVLIDLEKSNAAAEERAGELRREISVRRNMETGLLAAIEAADAADIAKSEFLTNISHELRTPMTVIMSSTEILLKEATHPPQRQFLGIIKESSDSMLALINNLIDYSRTERGDIELDIRRFVLRDEIRECLVPFNAAAHSRGLTLQCAVDPQFPDQLIGDAVRFRQILANLLDNAVKFTPTGGIRVDVRVHDLADCRVRIQVSVHDTGVGIDPAMHDHVFEPFTQADGSSTRRHGGTGLGLSLARRLVELMAGRIWLESTPGRGSAFHFLVEMSLADPIAGHDVTQAVVETEIRSS